MTQNASPHGATDADTFLFVIVLMQPPTWVYNRRLLITSEISNRKGYGSDDCSNLTAAAFVTMHVCDKVISLSDLVRRWKRRSLFWLQATLKSLDEFWLNQKLPASLRWARQLIDRPGLKSSLWCCQRRNQHPKASFDVRQSKLRFLKKSNRPLILIMAMSCSLFLWRNPSRTIMMTQILHPWSCTDTCSGEFFIVCSRHLERGLRTYCFSNCHVLDCSPLLTACYAP